MMQQEDQSDTPSGGEAAAAAPSSSSVATNSRTGGAPSSWAVKSSDEGRQQQQNPSSTQFPASEKEESVGSVRSRRRKQPDDSGVRTATGSVRSDTESLLLFPPDMGPEDETQKDNNNFRDWLATGTLDILKMTGGVALSTTGKLVAPPIQMTRMLLPGLTAAIIDWVDKAAPERVKDWFRIFSSSIYHLVTVLKNTEQGHVFRSRLGQVGGDLRDLASSDIALQAIVDTMSASVKFTEALHTPEVRSLLEQLGVLGCRVVDAAASGENKRLIHNAYELLWDGIELLADPSTTLAIAEVTANLCHALEMEEEYPRDAKLSEREKATNRRERTEQQKRTYHGKSFDDPISSVEEVILSSLRTKSSGFSGRIPMDDDSVVSNYEFESQNEEAPRTQRPFPGSTLNGKTDVAFLRERIEDRAFQSRRKKNLKDGKITRQATQTMSNVSSTIRTQQGTPTKENKTEEVDIEDSASVDPPLTTSVGGILRSAKNYSGTEGSTRQRKNNETSTDFFYRVLDDTMSSPKLRNDMPRKRQSRYTVKNSLSDAVSQEQKRKKRNLPLIIVAIALVISLATLLGCFALYGIIQFVSTRNNMPSISFPRVPVLSSMPNIFSRSEQSEVVIRIVREVVHVDVNGNILSTLPDELTPAGDVEKVKECLSSSLDEKKK